MTSEIASITFKTRTGEKGLVIEFVEDGLDIKSHRNGVVLDKEAIEELYEYCGEVLDEYWRKECEPIQAMIEKASTPNIKVH